MYNSTINLKNDAAKALLHYIRDKQDESYFFFGKSSTWGTGDTKPQVVPKKRLQDSTFKDMILLYNVDKHASTLCFDRVDWVKNNVMTQYNYEDDTLKCYALTSEFNVYKCIANNNGSPTLYEPNHTTFDIKEYTDGYKWKYLYTLSSLERRAFLSTTKIPIEVAPRVNSTQHITEFNAVSGTIDSYNILNSGSNYTDNAIVKITGDGIGAAGRLVTQNGLIKRIHVTNPGKNYTYANISITDTGIEGLVTANISPFAGHGSNLIEELNASSVMFNSRALTSTQNTDAIPKLFDYRKIGIVTGIQSNKNDFLIPACYKIQVEDSTGFTVNSLVKLNNGTTCNIVYIEIVLGEHILYLNEAATTLTAGSFVNNRITSVKSPTVSSRVLNTIYIPNINKNFNVIYLENLTKRTCIDQELDILRIVIDF